MQIIIRINTDNAAFEHQGQFNDDEVIRILHDYCERVSEYGTRMSHGRLMDVNGNTCGEVRIEE